jgi:Fibrillar collagen C-terminal domain
MQLYGQDPDWRLIVQNLIKQQTELADRLKLQEEINQRQDELIKQLVTKLDSSVALNWERNQDSVSLSKFSAKEAKSLPRTCDEILHLNPNSQSGEYLIDPDGDGVGDPAISVECDMTTGK